MIVGTDPRSFGIGRFLRIGLLSLSLFSAAGSFVACGSQSAATPSEAPTPPGAVPVDEPVDAKPGLPPVVKGGAPPAGAAELYQACQARVEGTEVAGECSSDADCVKAGCSQELCISTAEAAKGPMSTCEVRPCFQVLEACGCNEGLCRWSVAETP